MANVGIERHLAIEHPYEIHGGQEEDNIIRASITAIEKISLHKTYSINKRKLDS